MRAERAASDAVADIEAGAPAILTVDLGALAANWGRLRDRSAPAQCAAVVKADAYGIGIEKAVSTLRAAGCRTFFVAHLGEAERVRRAAPGAVIYVFNGLLPGEAQRFAALDVRPVLGSRAEIGDWAEFCRGSGRRLPAALHVDTGMNRLGLPVDEALALAGDPLLVAFEPALLMSHLVCAEEPDNPINGRQAAAFAAVRAAFAGLPAALANSSGIYLPQGPQLDLVRPGYALYGGNPTPGTPNPMRAVVHLAAPIIQLRWIEAGETVGYNARWTAPVRRRLATLSIGYADGYPRAASGTDRAREEGIETGAAMLAGHVCPFVGHVSMDLIVIDVSDVPADAAQRGAMATLIGDGIELDDVARRAGTIGYEILTGLGHRYARRYVNG